MRPNPLIASLMDMFLRSSLMKLQFVLYKLKMRFQTTIKAQKPANREISPYRRLDINWDDALEEFF